jgi:low temperature requirement protein LtrA
MVAVMIVAAVAVADEFVLHHPDGRADDMITVTVLGNTALFLIGILLFKWAITERWHRSHLLGFVLLGLLLPVACHLSPVLVSFSATLVLIGMVAWEQGITATTHKILHE